MSAIPGTIPVTGQLAPTDTTDTFPSHDAIYGLDGHRSVADHTARNAISTDRYREGMLVFTASDGFTWQATAATCTNADADWTQFGVGGLSNPMTTVGDMIVGGTAGTPTRLAATTNGFALQLASGTPAWVAPFGTFFAESQDISSPNNFIPTNALTPLPGGIPFVTDIDIALLVQGQGALLLNIPNSSYSGGNKRGRNAIDLQLSRGNASQVAGGSWSAIVGGNSHTASGTQSGCYGGSSNIAQATSSVCVGGQSNFSNGTFSVIAGGQQNTTSAQSSFAAGEANLADGLSSATLGNGGSTRGVTGSLVHSTGVVRVTGGDQGTHLVLRGVTVDATTVVPLISDNNISTVNAVNQWAVPANSGVYVRAQVIARNAATGDCGWWTVDVACKNIAGTVSLSGTVVVSAVNGDTAMNTCTVTAVPDPGGHPNIQFQVTGIAATTVQWTASGWSVENTA